MRTSVYVIVLGLALAGTAVAGPVEDSIVRQLHDQGFDRISVSRTFLGRSRIKASGRAIEREIIVNPATGEILRDYWVRRDKGESSIFSPGSGSSGSNSGSGSGNSGSGSDNSGPGSQNSGSGSGNSGRGSSNSGSGSGNSGSGSGNSGSGSGNSGSGGGNSGPGGGDDDDDDDDDD
ncbi:hypothetical protein [Ruegeria sp. HKCCD8929]|uniref:hypothetical protein n=1 Tax=Ruegeria sp. HKCCD8929 TaxID=2683006 RepID=UPI001582F741|nr:hypothetical protein [Ruegeria sp. HKCCD8929]